MPIVKSSPDLISQGLLCPDGKRRIECRDKDIPSPHIERRAIPVSVTEPVPVAVPVRHGGACRCDENTGIPSHMRNK